VWSSWAQSNHRKNAKRECQNRKEKTERAEESHRTTGQPSHAQAQHSQTCAGKSGRTSCYHLGEQYQSASRCQHKFSEQRLFTAPSRQGDQTGLPKGWHAERLRETPRPVKKMPGLKRNLRFQIHPNRLLFASLDQRQISVPSAVHDRVRGSQAGKSHDFRYPGRGVTAPDCRATASTRRRPTLFPS